MFISAMHFLVQSLSGGPPSELHPCDCDVGTMYDTFVSVYASILYLPIESNSPFSFYALHIVKQYVQCIQSTIYIHRKSVKPQFTNIFTVTPTP